MLDEETRKWIIEDATVFAAPCSSESDNIESVYLYIDEANEGIIIYGNLLQEPSEADLELLDDIGSNLFANYLEVGSDKYVISVGAEQARKFGLKIFGR